MSCCSNTRLKPRCLELSLKADNHLPCQQPPTQSAGTKDLSPRAAPSPPLRRSQNPIHPAEKMYKPLQINKHAQTRTPKPPLSRKNSCGPSHTCHTTGAARAPVALTGTTASHTAEGGDTAPGTQNRAPANAGSPCHAARATGALYRDNDGCVPEVGSYGCA
ncbi:hypothetical protein IQ07DRAFT_70371 [Pyrenochaeta sp. DS3sAY3a]|nr:hypothetical protein IQ07DRAFT_70371 [Pyrenochaeta sp. DS3sAY3a]